jgi:predicted nucleic acid-binding protein
VTAPTAAATVERAPQYLYVDSSSLIRVTLGDHNAAALHRIIVGAGRNGATLVSSRLLELEARRTSIRLALDGLDPSPIEAWVDETTLVPIDDDVWRGAMRISPT